MRSPGVMMYLAGGRVDLTGKDLQKSGFSGSIRANDAITVAGSEFQIDLLEQYAFAVAEGKVIYVDHAGGKGTISEAFFLENQWVKREPGPSAH